VVYDSLGDYELGFPGPLRDKLVAAVLDGSKTSTTGLLIGYEVDGEPLPLPGHRSTLIDSGGQPVAILEVTEVRQVPVGEIDLAHAIDEGEGYTTVADWRAAHEDFWHSPQLREYLGQPDFTVDDGTVAVAERFRVTSLIPDETTVGAAVAAESAALVAALRTAPVADLDRPTCCPPWTVRGEFAHAAIALSRTLAMLDAPAPAGPPVDTARYYSPDERFSPATDRQRVDTAQEYAEQRTPAELIDWFEQMSAQVVARVAGVSGSRLVTTRHGDPMRLTDFQVTRVVELAVHGLDLADALGVAPWLTAQAAGVVEGLLFGLAAPRAARELGVDRAGLLRRVTGRTPLSDAERARLRELGITWLTLG
jgi:uncharacterized protein (TIGR03083 family)